MSRSTFIVLLSAMVAGYAHQTYAADTAAADQSVRERYQLEEARSPMRESPGWRKPKRILVVGSFPQLIQQLEAIGPGVEFVTATSPAAAASKAADVDAVIGACTPEVLAAGKAIRWIQVYTAGVENCVAIPAVRERSILVTNMQRISGPVMAEHVLAIMLAFTRGLDVFIPAQSKRAWRRDAAEGRMTLVRGKTMLVVGLGGIGSEVARLAHAAGMRVIATRASGRTGPDYVSYVGLPDELLKLAGEADVVVNTAPLTPQTTGVFDAEFFAQMKPTAYFINVGRGKSVVTSALVDALSSGAIAGAGLDVTDPEPLPAEHPLWRAPNLIVTPHVANDSDLGFGAQAEVIKENTRRYVAGERMLSVVDVARGY
jgi:phosphoglycerate dehydrogenase-like enzyme